MVPTFRAGWLRPANEDGRITRRLPVWRHPRAKQRAQRH